MRKSSAASEAAAGRLREGEVFSRLSARISQNPESPSTQDFTVARPLAAGAAPAPAGRAHDLGREIAPLRSAVPPERWEEVSKHFSNLVLYVRTQLMAATSSEPHATALAECGGAIAEVVHASASGRLVTHVDPSNLTMFLHPDWARVGIFVGGATPGTSFE